MRKIIILISIILYTNFYQAQTDVYGVTTEGGAYNVGTIYKTDISGNNYTKIKDLVAYPQNQSLKLCKANDGNYYAFGSLRGNFNIYKYDVVTQESVIINTLKSIADTMSVHELSITTQNLNPGFVLAPNGKLYAMVKHAYLPTYTCSYSIIEFDPTTNALIIKQTISGIYYGERLGHLFMASNNKIYVTIQNNIYEYNYTTNTLTLKASPNVGFMHPEFAEYNGNLYSLVDTTSGSYPYLVSIGKYNLSTSAFTELKIAAMSGMSYTTTSNFYGLELASNGHLYYYAHDLWANSNNIYDFNPISNTLVTSLTNVTPGSFYNKFTKASNGKLYCIGSSTAICTPTCVSYSVYEYNATTNNLTEKQLLNGSIDNDIASSYSTWFSVNNPSTIIASFGNSIIEYNTSINSITKRAQMARSMAAFPNGKPIIKNNSLFQHIDDTKFNGFYDSNLYNTRNYGSILNYGIASNTITQVNPLLIGIGGNFIDLNLTDIFSSDVTNSRDSVGFPFNTTFNTTANTFTRFASNISASGYFSKATDGLIYGTGIEFVTGNDYNCIYAVDLANNIEYVVNYFTNNLQGFDMSGIMQASNSKMYGITKSGGVFGKGVLYSMDITGYNVTKLLDFNGAVRGANPDGQLIQATNGKIYGTTRKGGTNNKGVLFSYDITTNQFQKLIDFDGVTKGEQPNGYLQLLPNNLIMGMTYKGGANDKGVMFTYNYVTNTFTKKIDFDGINNGAYPNKCGFTYDCLALPMPNAGPDKIICNNGQVVLGDPANSNLYNYMWTPTVGINMPTAPNPTLTVSTNTTTIIMNASCDQTNVIDTVMINSIAPQTPMICEVTVDSLSQYNHVIWNKTAYSNVDSFIVYREVVTGYYLRIGAQPYSMLSDFQDTSRSIGPANGNPNIGTYRYKLQIKDSCGNLGALSPYHNSIYFNNNNGTFTWNTYDVQGNVTPVSQFNLIRDNSNTGSWQIVGSVTGSQNVLNDPAYTTYSATANWRVEALGFNCNPTAKTTQQINKTKSNVKNNFTVIVTSLSETLSPNDILISPNPVVNELAVSFNKELTERTLIFVTDLLGKTVYSSDASNGTKVVIPLADLTRGIYFLNLQQGKSKTVKKFIKE